MGHNKRLQFGGEIVVLEIYEWEVCEVVEGTFSMQTNCVRENNSISHTLRHSQGKATKGATW